MFFYQTTKLSLASPLTSFCVDSLSTISSRTIFVLIIGDSVSSVWPSIELVVESFLVKYPFTFMKINAVNRGKGVMVAAATGITAKMKKKHEKNSLKMMNSSFAKDSSSKQHHLIS